MTLQNIADCLNTNGEQAQITASSIIRSHSVSGDLHGVPPDPVAADILRKEPEQETFVRLKITPNGIYFPISYCVLSRSSSTLVYIRLVY